jgi:hypothetical protein
MRILLIFGLLAVSSGASDYYRLPGIKRIYKDLYRSAKVVIETRSCLHLPLAEEALLKYEAPGEYEIIWEDQSVCDVQKVIALD